MNNRLRICLVDPPYPRLINRDMYSSTVSKGGYKWPAADLLEMSGIVREITEDILLIDANVEGLTDDETIARIAHFNPTHLVFMSGASAKENDLRFVERVKLRLPEVKAIGSGGLLFHGGLSIMEQNPAIDAVVLNFTTRDINRYINGEIQDLCNFLYRDESGAIQKTPENYHRDPYRHAMPLHEMLVGKDYFLSHAKFGPITSVLTSYGCPAQCSYCVTESIKYRPRDVENVIEELKLVKSLGFRTVFFRDATFLASRRLGVPLLERMIEENLGLSWVADTRASCVDEEKAPLIAKAGGHCLHFGIESADPRILQEYSKGVTHDQIRKAVELCRKYGIRTLGYFILGLPGETTVSVRKTIDLAISLRCDYASFNMPMPIVGTTLRKTAIEKGWILGKEAKTYDGSYETLIETPELRSNEVLKLLSEAKRRFYLRPSYFYQRISQVRTSYEFRSLMREFIGLVLEVVRKSATSLLRNNPWKRGPRSPGAVAR